MRERTGDREDNVIRFDDSDDFLLDTAAARVEERDFEGALRLVAQYKERAFPPDPDAYVISADAYEELGIYSLGADAWYRYLDTCEQEELTLDAFEGLSVCLMNMGENELASAYFKKVRPDQRNKLHAILYELYHAGESGRHRELVLLEEEEINRRENFRKAVAAFNRKQFETARTLFTEFAESNPKYYDTAMCYAVVCSLVMNDSEGAIAQMQKIYEDDPKNADYAATYCHALCCSDRREEAEKIAAELSKAKIDDVSTLYNVVCTLCANGFSRLAYEQIKALNRTRMNYDANILWYTAVCKSGMGDLEKAAVALERLSVIYPRKAIAKYYLKEVRRAIFAGKTFELDATYGVPDEKYEEIEGYFKDVLSRKKAPEPREEEFLENFYIAFDEKDGGDDALQILAALAAVRVRYDDCVREILLDFALNPRVQDAVMKALVVRGELNSFGCIRRMRYLELVTVSLDIGKKKAQEFYTAFAEVYVRFCAAPSFPSESEDEEALETMRKVCELETALTELDGDESDVYVVDDEEEGEAGNETPLLNERDAFKKFRSIFVINKQEGVNALQKKLIVAAEELYGALSDCGAYAVMDETEVLAAMLFLSAHLSSGLGRVKRAAQLFGADEEKLRKALELIS